eukprot:COSAG02_NODE_959_length_15647_cov_74.362748_12_plen_165_part_00
MVVVVVVQWQTSWASAFPPAAAVLLLLLLLLLWRTESEHAVTCCATIIVCVMCGRGKDDMEDVPADQHNMYTELQTGVMPTQYQGFPLQPQSSREWTEFFTTDVLDSSELESLMSPDYHGEAIPSADQLLESKGLSVSLTCISIILTVHSVFQVDKDSSREHGF